MKKIKIFVAAALAATMLIGTSMTAFAYGWVYDTDYLRKYYTDADNTEYLSGGWYWLDDDGDGIEECYYFRDDGYSEWGEGLAHMKNPRNGAYVNDDGVWVVCKDPVSVQRRAVGTTLADVAGTIDKSVEGTYYLYHTWCTYPDGDWRNESYGPQEKYYEPNIGDDVVVEVPDDETVIMVDYYSKGYDRIFNKDYDGDYCNALTISSHCTTITFPTAGMMVTDLYDGWYREHRYAVYLKY